MSADKLTIYADALAALIRLQRGAGISRDEAIDMLCDVRLTMQAAQRVVARAIERRLLVEDDEMLRCA
jgi:hypothetical protein